MTYILETPQGTISTSSKSLLQRFVDLIEEPVQETVAAVVDTADDIAGITKFGPRERMRWAGEHMGHSFRRRGRKNRTSTVYRLFGAFQIEHHNGKMSYPYVMLEKENGEIVVSQTVGALMDFAPVDAPRLSEDRVVELRRKAKPAVQSFMEAWRVRNPGKHR